MHPTPLSPKRHDQALSALLTTLERIVDAVQGAPVLPVAPHRLVVLKSCCLGDVLLATPLLAALRRAYPWARLVAGVGRWARPALLNNPDLDGVLDLETVGLGGLRPAAYTRVVRRLRTGRFDVALVLDRTPVLTGLPLLADIPVRAGIDSGGRGFPLNVRVPWEAVEHEAKLFLRVGAALGVPTHDAPLRFVPTTDDHARAAELWQQAGLRGSRVAAVFPGGGRNPGMVLDAKRWPPARYAALADRLHADHGLAVVLAGSDDDRPVTATVQRLMHAPAVDLAGRTGFGTLGAIFARCALFAGNDCGPMHLAAALGTPVLAIFGPTDPAVYGPLSPRSVALRGPHGLSTEEVSVEDAVAAAGRLLGT
jgi:lipopolysaccharide heptosyltransferase II